jgi:hypothetical protein
LLVLQTAVVSIRYWVGSYDMGTEALLGSGNAKVKRKPMNGGHLLVICQCIIYNIMLLLVGLRGFVDVCCSHPMTIAMSSSSLSRAFTTIVVALLAQLPLSFAATCSCSCHGYYPDEDFTVRSFVHRISNTRKQIRMNEYFICNDDEIGRQL